ncbi:MAG: DUF6567 family protein [Methylobacter sp.]
MSIHQFGIGKPLSSPNNAAAHLNIYWLALHCREADVMTKFLKMLPILCLLTGCAAIPALPALSGLIPASGGGPQILTTTEVKLARQNFKIVKANTIGSSVGFSLLGFIILKSPDYAEAIANLYRHVSEGKAQTFANVVQESSSTYFILFALPKITMHADIIEFTENTVQVNTQDTENIKQ